MGLTATYNIALQGLFTSQSMLQLTSHNLTNVNTPGFSRQRATLDAIPSVSSGGVVSGGVRVSQISRNVDTMVERRLVMEEHELGRLAARDRFLPLVEDVFNDMDGNGMGTLLDGIYSSAENLADNPGNPVGRTELVAQATAFAQFVNGMSQKLDRVAMPVDDEITGKVDLINSKLKELATLNNEVVKQGNTSAPALDLEDQRQQKLLELSNMMDVTYYMNDLQGVTVMTSGGKLLLDSGYTATLERKGSTDLGFQGVSLVGQDVDITNQIKSGEIKGLMELRDEIIYGDTDINGVDGWNTKLEKLVDEVRWQFNLRHSQSVGSTMFSTQTGVFDVGSDATQTIATLASDDAYGAPPDLDEVGSGTLTIAYGSDPDNLSKYSINIDPNTMSIQDVVNSIDSANVQAQIVNGKVTLTGLNGNSYGVVEDESGIMAALGVGALFSGNDALDLAVSSELVTDPKRVGASRLRQDDSGQVFFDDMDNQGAISLAELRTEVVELFETSGSLSDHYAAMVGDLGSVVSRNEGSYTTHKISRDFVADYRESIAGVSIDEELTSLIRYQRTFQAASKIISVTDELMQSIISMV